MEELDLSIIIISFNTKEYLINCINSIYNTIKNLNYEIIVVDNASADGSPEMIEATFGDLKLIKNKENLGFAKANNQGIKVAKGNYLLLLNSDTIVPEGTIETLVKFINEHPNAAAVGPKVLNFDGTLQTKGYNFPSLKLSFICLIRIPKFLPEGSMRRFFHKYYWGENDTTQVDWLGACCLLVRKKTIDKIGMLCEDFFMYFEDQEWCYRARKKKYEIWYVPTAEIFHQNWGSPLSIRADLGRIGQLIFYQKSLGLFKGVMIHVVSVLSLGIAYVTRLLNPSASKEREETRGQLREQMEFLKLLISNELSSTLIVKGQNKG